MEQYRFIKISDQSDFCIIGFHVTSSITAYSIGELRKKFEGHCEEMRILPVNGSYSVAFAKWLESTVDGVSVIAPSGEMRYDLDGPADVPESTISSHFGLGAAPQAPLAGTLPHNP